MEHRKFGRSSVPVVGQGTWNMEQDDRASAIQALRRGIDLGLTHIDTAELYGRGRVEEEILADVIAGQRDKLFLVSKVMPNHATYEGTLAACESSLKRLRTDHLDCYLLHWPGSHPLDRTIAAFEKLVTDGKIRSWGVSNFDVHDLDQALAIAGEGRIACNQVLYHLQERAIEAAVLPWCVKHGVTVVAYSPFGSGDFPEPQSKGGRVLAQIAKQHHATPHQIALGFLLRDPHTLAIPKASDVKHVEANAQAGELRLTPEELKQIAAAFPLRSRGDLPTI